MSRSAILLVDHGSRRPEANSVLDAIAELLRRRLPGRVVEVAHMELAAPSIAEGIDACVRAGAREIIVHPYFLAPGGHGAGDVPALAAAAAGRHQNVSIRVTAPLGVHEALVDVILARIEEV